MKVVRKKIGGAARNGGIGKTNGKMMNGNKKDAKMDKERNGSKSLMTKLLNLLMKEFKP